MDDKTRTSEIYTIEPINRIYQDEYISNKSNENLINSERRNLLPYNF
jgi:hypothetical protein